MLIVKLINSFLEDQNGKRYKKIYMNYTSVKNILSCKKNYFTYIYIYIYCKDSICNDPKLILGSYIKGSNNKIYREWAERLGLDH